MFLILTNAFTNISIRCTVHCIPEIKKFQQPPPKKSRISLEIPDKRLQCVCTVRNKTY